MSTFPHVHISDSTSETNPSMQPEIIMDLTKFESEVNREDYRHFPLPVAYSQDRCSHQWMLTRGDTEIELLLFPVLYPWGRGHWQAKPFHERQPFQDTRMEDAKIKLS